jgi:hypothetical protein
MASVAVPIPVPPFLLISPLISFVICYYTLPDIVSILLIYIVPASSQPIPFSQFVFAATHATQEAPTSMYSGYQLGSKLINSSYGIEWVTLLRETALAWLSRIQAISRKVDRGWTIRRFQ